MDNWAGCLILHNCTRIVAANSAESLHSSRYLILMSHIGMDLAMGKLTKGCAVRLFDPTARFKTLRLDSEVS